MWLGKPTHAPHCARYPGAAFVLQAHTQNGWPEKELLSLCWFLALTLLIPVSLPPLCG
jgi:hypothetical protein